MHIKTHHMKEIKRIALIAHDNRKKDLIGWIEWNWNKYQGRLFLNSW